MDKFMKSLKTTKRRLSQQLKVATGKAETTTDAAFDAEYARFTDMENNLKAMSVQCVSLIHNVDTWCDTNRRLADELLSFTNKSDHNNEEMQRYKQTITNLHSVLQGEYNYTRRSIILILRTHIANRIDSLLKEEFEEVQKTIKMRKNIITDYDSHREKCSMFEKKGDSSNAEKFRRKMDHDYQMLQEHTEFLLHRFEELLQLGGAILSQETSTLIACEMYLVKKQHEAMQSISSSFQQSTIEEVNSTIDSIVYRIREGENVEMSYVPPERSLPVFERHEAPVVTDYSASVYQELPLPNPPPPPPLKKQYVKALYSMDNAEEGELIFKEGDTIEVLREDGSGWWEGKLNNQVGRFPSNYTAACSFVS